MSFSLAIAFIIIADVALIAGLAFVMSRASLLNPHVSGRNARAAVAVADTATVTAVPTRTRHEARSPRRRPQTSAA